MVLVVATGQGHLRGQDEQGAGPPRRTEYGNDAGEAQTEEEALATDETEEGAQDQQDNGAQFIPRDKDAFQTTND